MVLLPKALHDSQVRQGIGFGCDSCSKAHTDVGNVEVPLQYSTGVVAGEKRIVEMFDVSVECFLRAVSGAIVEQVVVASGGREDVVAVVEAEPASVPPEDRAEAHGAPALTWLEMPLQPVDVAHTRVY
jgi:hypothetical protein